MSEKGKVLKLNQEKNLITIEFVPQSACKSCGICLAGTASEASRMEITVLNTVGAKEGDSVSFEIKGEATLKASFLLYGFPLSLLLIGFALGQYLAIGLNLPKDATSLFFAALFFFGAFFFLGRISKAQGDIIDHIKLQRIN